MDLDNVLDEKYEAPKEEAPSEPAVTTEPTTPAEPVREPTHKRRAIHREKEQTAQGKERDPTTGQFVPKAAEVAPAPEAPKQAEPKPADAPAPGTPPQDLTAREKAYLRAAHEERQKRQELERRYGQQQPAAPAEPAKAFWDDPEGHLKSFEERLAKGQINTRLNTAEMIARSRYQDFDDKVAVFGKLAESTPGLMQQMLQAPDPAEFAYRTGFNHQRLEQAGSMDAIIQKAREEAAAEARTKVEAEYKAKAEQAERVRSSIPPSLSDARSTGGPRTPAWGGPTSLGDMLK